jgi:hypothetical protein
VGGDTNSFHHGGLKVCSTTKDQINRYKLTLATTNTSVAEESTRGLGKKRRSKSTLLPSLVHSSGLRTVEASSGGVTRCTAARSRLAMSPASKFTYSSDCFEGIPWMNCRRQKRRTCRTTSERRSRPNQRPEAWKRVGRCSRRVSF